jgi:hypothetical protein
MIEAWTGEGHGAKQGAQGARVGPFDPERLPTVFALGTGGDKGRGLLFHEALLQRGEDLLRFRQRQAEVLDALAGLLEDCHIGEGFFMAIVIAHHELDSDLMGAILQSG